MAKLMRTCTKLKTGALPIDRTSGPDGVRSLSELGTLLKIQTIHDSEGISRLLYLFPARK
jgi:hypothetical protein